MIKIAQAINFFDVILVIFAIIPAIIAIIFFYQSYQRRRQILYLNLAFISAVFAPIIVPNDNPMWVVPASLALLFFFLHYEVLSSNNVNLRIFTVLIGLVGIISTLAILPSIGFVLNSDVRNRLAVGTGFLIIIVSLITWGRAVNITYKTHSLAQERATKIELIALIFFLVGYILSFAFTLGLILTGINVEEISFFRDAGIPSLLIPVSPGLIPSLIALILYLSNYIIHPEYIYRIPFQIHSIMLYNASGLPVYSRQVQAQPFQGEFQDALVSGLFTAISALIQETLGAGAQLSHIDATSYQIFFSQMPQNASTLAVIATDGTSIFQQSLDRFLQTIPDDLVEKINAPMTNIKLIRPDFDNILKQSFPYLIIDSTT